MVLEEVQKLAPQTSRISSSRLTMSPGREMSGVQQVVLLPGQHDLPLGAPDSTCLRVDTDVLDLEHRQTVGKSAVRALGNGEIGLNGPVDRSAPSQ